VGNYFGGLTPRMQSFREELLNVQPQICVERAVIVTKVYRENQDQPLALKRALMLKSVLEQMSIFIEPQTLLAGNQASSNRSAPIFPEYAMSWVIEELDSFAHRDGDVFHISEENKGKLREIAPFWEHNTLLDRGLAAFPLIPSCFMIWESSNQRGTSLPETPTVPWIIKVCCGLA